MTIPSITADRLGLLQEAGMQRLAPAAVFDIRGPGALTCMQGLLTNDLVKPGDGALVYGALLTPKGMIVADGWAFRLSPEHLLFLTEPQGHDGVAEIFRRTMPPRLAKVTDHGGSWEALWLHGEPVATQLDAAGLTLATAAGGRCAEAAVGGTAVVHGRPPAQAPFRAVVTGSKAVLETLHATFTATGLATGSVDDAAAFRILAGWPALGREILERTLPQEVRFDEHDGVSYSKGCYTGQETVARLHFRGHTNRELRGLVWSQPPAAEARSITAEEGQDAGLVTSLLRLGDRTVGLGLVRREVALETAVVAAGAPARVVALPFSPSALSR